MSKLIFFSWFLMGCASEHASRSPAVSSEEPVKICATLLESFLSQAGLSTTADGSSVQKIFNLSFGLNRDNPKLSPELIETGDWVDRQFSYTKKLIDEASTGNKLAAAAVDGAKTQVLGTIERHLEKGGVVYWHANFENMPAIVISPNGSTPLNRFAKAMTEKMDTQVVIIPELLLRDNAGACIIREFEDLPMAERDLVFREPYDMESGERKFALVLPIESLVKLSPADDSVAHEIMHIQRFSQAMKEGFIKATVGGARVKDGSLPGIGPYADSGTLSFQELDTHCYSLNLRFRSIIRNGLEDRAFQQAIQYKVRDQLRWASEISETVLILVQRMKRAVPTFEISEHGIILAKIGVNAPGNKVASITIPLVKNVGQSMADETRLLAQKISELEATATERLTLYKILNSYVDYLEHQTLSPQKKQNLLRALIKMTDRRPDPGEVNYYPLDPAQLSEIWQNALNQKP